MEDLKAFLIDLIERFPTTYFNELRKLKDFAQVKSDILTQTSFVDQYNISLASRIYLIVNDMPSTPKCIVCGNPITSNIRSMAKGFRLHCCRKCAVESDHRKSAYQTTCIQRYGVSNISKSDQCKQKKINTSLRHYGVDNPAKSDIVKETTAQTNLARYGLACPLMSDSIRQKSIQTNIIRYGVPSYSQTTEYIEKCKSTNNDKFGVDYPNQNPEIRRAAQKKYKFDNLQFDSKPEIAFYIWHRDNNSDFEYQPSISFEYSVNGRTYSYHPDFRVADKYVELKGLHFFKDRDPTKQMINPYDAKLNNVYEAKHQCMIANNIVIITDFTKYLKFAKNKYGVKWYI